MIFIGQNCSHIMLTVVTLDIVVRIIGPLFKLGVTFGFQCENKSKLNKSKTMPTACMINK
jgi:hypothetical protein